MTEKKGNVIKIDILSKYLGCPVVETTATKIKNNGLALLIQKTVEVGKKGTQQPPNIFGLKEAHSKREYKAADKRRFEFVKTVVRRSRAQKNQPGPADKAG